MTDMMKILYVDDEEMNLTLFKMIFKEKYDIVLAQNAITALELLESHTDTVIVITDMNMPQMNGIEFIKIAKEKFPKIKFYILTGYEINDEIDEALKEKLILKYFRKPFNFEEIDQTLCETCKQ